MNVRIVSDRGQGQEDPGTAAAGSRTAEAWPGQGNARGTKSSAFTMLALLPVARMTNRP